MPSSFGGLQVLSFESRRAREMAALITTYGGRPISAPALREVPLESNTAAVAFAAALIHDQIDVVILLTGVGTRRLLAIVDHLKQRDAFVAALGRTKVVPRGPKPLAVLRELEIEPWFIVPEPNTWRELLAALDEKANTDSLHGLRMAVQEYGVSNPELLRGLRERGASVTAVPVYHWALPEDVEPLRAAAGAVSRGEVDVAMFTTTTQVVHLFQIARELKLEDQVRRELNRMVVASIGPTTSEGLREEGVTPDLEPSHPKMGFLVKEAADRAGEILQLKRR